MITAAGERRMNIPFRFACLLLCIPGLLSAQTEIGAIINLPGLAFKYSVETSAGKDTVWRLWSDVDGWKRFDTALEFSRLSDGDSFGEGASGYLKAKGAPRTRFEILRVNEGVSFLVRLQLPLHHTIDQQRYFAVSDSGATVITHEVSFNGLLSPVIYAVLSRIYKKETRQVVDRLKLLAEQVRE